MKHRIIRLICLFSLVSCTCMAGMRETIAQTDELDSLNAFVKSHTQEDEALVDALARLSYLHNAFRPKEGIILGERALALSQKIDYQDGMSRSFNALGVNYYALEQNDQAILNYDSAVYYKELTGDKRGAMITTVNIGVIEAEQKQFNKALKRYELAYDHFEEIESYGLMGAVLVNMGIVHRRMYATSEALRVYILALEVAEKGGNQNAKATALSNIGMIYQGLENYESAIRSRKEAIVIVKETNNRRLEARLLNGLGSNYVSLRRYDSAMWYFDKVMEVSEELGVNSPKATAFSHMGRAMLNQGEYEKALEYYDKALELRQQQSNLVGHAAVYMNLGRVNRRMGKDGVAMRHFLKALEIARQRDEVQNIANSTEYLAMHYEKQGDVANAYRYYKMHKEASDKANDPQDLTELSALASRYQAEKESQELLLRQAEEEAMLQATLAAERRVRNIIILGLLAVLVLALVYYRYYRLKKRANEALESQNDIISQQKDSLALQAEKLQMVNSHLEMLSGFRTELTQMIAHDMKNPLNAIIGLSDGAPSERNVKKIAESGHRMLNLVTNMLEVEKLEEARMKPKLEEVYIDELIKAAKSQVELLLQAKSIFFQSLVPQQISLQADREIMVRVLVNLFTNAIKYSENGGAVRIRHEVLESGFLRLSVSDEGPGIAKDRLPHIFDKFWQSDQKKSGLAVSTGLGLTFCKLAIESHDGRIWAESEEGAGATFTFELALGQEACAQFKDLENLKAEDTGSLFVNGDRAKLVLYSDRLKNYKVHQVGAINRLIREMDDSHIVSKWKQDLQAAVYGGDQRKYDQLIEMLEDS